MTSPAFNPAAVTVADTGATDADAGTQANVDAGTHAETVATASATASVKASATLSATPSATLSATPSATASPAFDRGQPLTRKRLWMAAIKPPMYSVAVMPILWGAAIAHAHTHHTDWTRLGLFLGSAVLILAWENLANDVFDAETGIDANKHHSLVNLTGNKALVFALANGLLALGIGGIGAIAWMQGDWTVLALVLGCCGLGYLYQGPPFRLGYQGLGEVLCFFAFGPLAVGAGYYAQTQAWPEAGSVLGLGSGVMLSAIVGITTSLVLFCSHFHQVADDLAAGKRSPIVRLGTKGGARVLPIACGLVYGLIGTAVVTGMAPMLTLLSLASLPWAVQLCRHVGEFHNQPEQVSNCKFIAVALHFWSGLLFAVGFAFG